MAVAGEVPESLERILSAPKWFQQKRLSQPLVSEALGSPVCSSVNTFSERETAAGAAAAKSLQSCPTLCDPIDGSPPSSLLQCIKVKSEREVAQSCPTLSDPMDCSLPGSSIHGIFQARVLECGAIAFSRKGDYHMIFRIGIPLFPRFLSLLVPTLSELILAHGPSTSAYIIFCIAKKSSDALIFGRMPLSQTL